MILETTIYTVISLALAMKLYYSFRFFFPLGSSKPSEIVVQQKLPISVIICARNEAEALQENLADFLEQDYPNFEVIVVNDCSYDRSKEVLEEFSLKYPHLRVVQLDEDEKYKHGKKFALTLGIKAAKHEHVLLSDADCKPASKQWIEHMQSGFANEKDLVIGYSPEIKTKGFLNLFSRFETFYTAFQYISFSMQKKAYMGIGRNMAYTKSIFFKHKGFASHMHLLSGDDDLFVQEAATSENTIAIFSPESIIMTQAKENFSDYLRQKLRHYSVAGQYKSYFKWQLGLIAAANLFFIFGMIAAIVVGIDYRTIIGFFVFNLLFSTIIMGRAMVKLQVKDLIVPSALLEILYFIATPLFTLFSKISKPKKWK